MFLALVHQDGVEDIHQCFVDEECLEQRSDDGRAFSQNQKCAIDPGPDALEDGKEGDLREVCEQEEDDVDKGREENNG